MNIPQYTITDLRNWGLINNYGQIIDNDNLGINLKNQLYNYTQQN